MIFALIGVNNYGSGRVISALQADSLAEAAFFFGGTLLGDGETSLRKANLYFPRGSDCGVFVPGRCTAEILADGKARPVLTRFPIGGPKFMDKYETDEHQLAEVRNDLDEVYVQGLRLGSVPAPARKVK